MNVGTIVRVLPPFAESFSGQYQVTEVITQEDGQVCYILGELGAFDAKFLEVV